jgi:hypothetical protein
MDKRRSRLGSVLVAVVMSAVLSLLLAACGSSAASPTDAKPYVPPEASDTPTLDPSAELIPDGPLFLPLGKWLPSQTSERQLNPCLQQSFVVLGADKLRYRSFHASHKEAVAQDLVAVFHDQYAARQAAYLLRRWQETCGKHLGDDTVTANAPKSVGPGRGSALWFTTYDEGASGEFTRSATGLVQVGQIVGLVTVQDKTSNDNPDAVEAAMERMVQRGYSRLG